MQHCNTCSADLIAGTLFCDKCGASQNQVKVARKLRQGSFDAIRDAKEGILSPGERLKGRQVYIIEEAVARSGFGATFRALRTKDDTQILIKQMLDQPHYDQFKTQLFNSFKREAKFLRKIKHPAFPRGHEYFERNKSFYLVMDFINGKDLNKAIEEYRKQSKGVIEDGLIVYLGVEIADALEVIHNQGYIYRDLKPHNVMLDGISARVKLIDFGTLYHSSDTDPLIFESEGYTPPEFKVKTNKFTPAGDVFSLGALLYELATGETPKPDAKLPGKHDKRLCAIVEKCLKTDPLQRYQRARNVRDELTKLTRKGFWPFRNAKMISPVELSVLPKTLYPSACTFCEFCGFADANSQAGYCKKCRVPLRVGRISMKVGKTDQKEFFLYADETILGSSKQCPFPIGDPNLPKKNEGVSPEHARIFRRKNGLWLESLTKEKDNTLLNQRKILGPVELRDGDVIELANVVLQYNIKDAC